MCEKEKVLVHQGSLFITFHYAKCPVPLYVFFRGLIVCHVFLLCQELYLVISFKNLW